MLVAAALFGILTSACPVYAVYDVYAPGSCEHYKTITNLVQECRQQEGTLHILKQLSVGGYTEYTTKLTQSKLIEDIQAFCRNVIPKYMECIQRSNVMQECGITEDISQLTTGWISIYCNGENVANWLRQYVAYGFNYTHTCSINNMSLKCYFNRVFRDNGHKLNGDSIKAYNFWVKRLTADWFACTKEEMPKIRNKFRQCTTTWQDVLLTDWLYNSLYYNPGLRLYPEQMSQILTLKMEAVNRNQPSTYNSLKLYSNHDVD